MKLLKGMVAAMPTPFKADESIDMDGVKKLLQHLIDGGMSAVLIGGSTGEYSLMSMDERKALIKTACEYADGKINILAGCSCPRPVHTKEMVAYSAEAGADFALVIPPYYLKTSDQGIIDYYKEVAKDSKIGIIIYNYPGATGVQLSPELTFELGKIDNVIGIKDTDEMEHTSKLIALFKDNDDFTVINGCEHLIMGSLACGGEGTMGIIHNLVPKQMMEIYKAMQDNDYKKASEVNAKLTTLYTLMELEPYPGPIKAALELLGLPGGVPRKPVVPPSKEMVKALETEMKKIGLI